MTFAVGLGGIGVGLAQDISSVYTEFNLDRCVIVQKIDESGAIIQRCQALDGFPIFVAEDDLRFFIGYGPYGRKQKVFGQTLAPFNSIHNKIEFRIKQGARQPFAAILRYFTDNGFGKPKGQVLSVTKIDGREACHIAYIDALANALAQKAADGLALNFNCARDEAKNIGVVGPSRM